MTNIHISIEESRTERISTRKGTILKQITAIASSIVGEGKRVRVTVNPTTYDAVVKELGMETDAPNITIRMPSNELIGGIHAITISRAEPEKGTLNWFATYGPQPIYDVKEDK